MDPPSSVVSREALQRLAYLLWEAAGFPPDQPDHFWLKAEQQLTAGAPAPAVTPARKAAAVYERKTPAIPATPATPPAPAAEAAPVHPTRRKPATKSAAPKPAAKPPAKPAPKAAGKPTAKSPRKSSGPPPAKQAAPVTKRPAKPRQPKTGDAS